MLEAKEELAGRQRRRAAAKSEESTGGEQGQDRDEKDDAGRHGDGSKQHVDHKRECFYLLTVLSADYLRRRGSEFKRARLFSVEIRELSEHVTCVCEQSIYAGNDIYINKWCVGEQA